MVLQFEGGSITGIPFLGEHGDLAIRTKMAHLIQVGGKSVMCAADSRNVEPVMYEHVRKIAGAVDVLFLGMECDGAPMTWLYGPLLMKPLDRKMDQSRRLSGSDCRRGMEGNGDHQPLELQTGLCLCHGPGTLAELHHKH